jgi:hypothetical protein
LLALGWVLADLGIGAEGAAEALIRAATARRGGDRAAFAVPTTLADQWKLSKDVPRR